MVGKNLESVDPEVIKLKEYVLTLEANIVKLNNQLCNLKAAPAELQTQINVIIELYRMLEVRVKNLEAKSNGK